MGLSTRELYLIIRARDEASRVVSRLSGSLDSAGRRAAALRIGQAAALQAVGAGMVAVGAAVIGTLNDLSQAHIDYAQAAATSFTQV